MTEMLDRVRGKLDDAVWANAKEVQLNRSFDGGPTTRKTTFRILWDDTNLYVAFFAEDPDIWGTKLNKDDDIYNEDALEVFIDANADQATYNELQVSPHNVNFDASFVARRSDLATAMKWESGMKTAVAINGITMITDAGYMSSGITDAFPPANPVAQFLMGRLT